MPRTRHFEPSLFQFLRELDRHNNREWFTANKERYELEVKQPMLRFIGDLGTPLRKISPHFLADPRPVGGSLFRVHRDTRFAKDKTPYKTQAAAQFRHSTGKDAHAPAFYLHLSPAENFAGAGMWHPEAPQMHRIREAMVDNPAAWKRATRGKAFTSRCALWGERLKRVPAGLDPAHPLAEDLKFKDFVAVADFTEDDVCRPGFLDRYVEVCRTTKPLMAFLLHALELPI